jgi:riboflavin kinase/FMN adenylyltransferase
MPSDARGASVALGNFDGVHLGHQAVIEAARRQGGRLAAAVFEPHPRQFFQPDSRRFRLQTPDQRARCLAAIGVDSLFEIAFDAELARMSHRDFARAILHERLGAQHVSVGQDFRFGRGRTGDAVELARLGAELGFGVSAIGAVRDDEGRISSSAIRAAIAYGDMEAAKAMLSRPWAIEGQVQRGFARGRGFGFATANVPLGEYIRPRLGIYAVRVHVSGASHDGVASVGVNPTVGALPEPLLEAHIFNFDRELYGETIEVEMIAFLREEAKFDDVEALKAQMAKDADAARKALK